MSTNLKAILREKKKIFLLNSQRQTNVGISYQQEIKSISAKTLVFKLFWNRAGGGRGGGGVGVFRFFPLKVRGG